jgi:hypothetical protein
MTSRVHNRSITFLISDSADPRSAAINLIRVRIASFLLAASLISR